MSVQRDLLVRMTEELPKKFLGCGILVAGSVQRGEEREDSDLDLFVVFRGDGQLDLTHETSAEGVKIDLALFPEEAFRRHVASEWFNFWMFSRAEIVHDPTGIAKRNQDIARSYFERRPDVACEWVKQMEEVRRHKDDRNHVLQHPTWESFSEHVRGNIAEPPAAATGEGVPAEP